MPVKWGGTDDYEYSFEPENRHNDAVVFKNGTLPYQTTNNNSAEHENLNLMNRKVSEHFARVISEAALYGLEKSSE